MFNVTVWYFFGFSLILH